MLTVRRALISVTDKRDLISFVSGLVELGIEIISTGGTCQQLKEAGIEAIGVSTKTDFPEIMDGRVKTLHPVIHGGLLGRRGTDEAVMLKYGIEPIDLLVVNLYPFESAISRPDVTFEEAIDNIDIGGPAMIRAGAKNHDGVIVIVDPDDYGEVLEILRNSKLSLEYRCRLAAKAYAHTSSYDAAITKYLSDSLNADPLGAKFIHIGNRVEKLRYGENPHQDAAFYLDQVYVSGTFATAKQLQGKALSYNNIADSDAALGCVRQFKEPACVIVKHANPCGVAIADDILSAYERAFMTDPTSAFGGIIAFNRPLDFVTARAIIDKQFVEVIVAPGFDEEALVVTAEKKNVRVLDIGVLSSNPILGLDYKKVSGGLLVQNTDTGRILESDLKVVTEQLPDANQINDLLFSWQVAKFVKSNAIVFCKDGSTIGIGAGQMSRIYSTKIAAIKAADEGFTMEGSVMASDAFFPFRDGVDVAAEYGIKAIIQPGGSMRDDEIIEAANEHGLAMVFTNMRHFRH